MTGKEITWEEVEKRDKERNTIKEAWKVKLPYQIGMMVHLANGTEHEAFRYYADELSFQESEVIGLTLDEARELFHKKDVDYLRS